MGTPLQTDPQVQHLSIAAAGSVLDEFLPDDLVPDDWGILTEKKRHLAVAASLADVSARRARRTMIEAALLSLGVCFSAAAVLGYRYLEPSTLPERMKLTSSASASFYADDAELRAGPASASETPKADMSGAAKRGAPAAPSPSAASAQPVPSPESIDRARSARLAVQLLNSHVVPWSAPLETEERNIPSARLSSVPPRPATVARGSAIEFPPASEAVVVEIERSHTNDGATARRPAEIAPPSAPHPTQQPTQLPAAAAHLQAASTRPPVDEPLASSQTVRQTAPPAQQADTPVSEIASAALTLAVPAAPSPQPGPASIKEQGRTSHTAVAATRTAGRAYDDGKETSPSTAIRAQAPRRTANGRPPYRRNSLGASAAAMTGARSAQMAVGLDGPVMSILRGMTEESPQWAPSVISGQ